MPPGHDTAHVEIPTMFLELKDIYIFSALILIEYESILPETLVSETGRKI